MWERGSGKGVELVYDSVGQEKGCWYFWGLNACDWESDTLTSKDAYESKN